MRNPVRLADLTEAVVGLFFPPHCPICKSASGPVSLCPECVGTLRQIHEPRCAICSEPFQGEITQEFTCPNCEGREFHLDCIAVSHLSRGALRNAIHQFKYQRALHLRHLLTDFLEMALDDERVSGENVDAFVPVPLHPTRFREREFNQSAVLARTLGKRRGIPVLDCLKRIRPTDTQTRHDRDERMENLRDAFQLRHDSGVQGKRLILIDDVVTTGSTLDECARVLRIGGALRVCAITVARG